MDETDAHTLGRIEGKMDLVVDMLKEDRKRISAVEKKVYWGSGLAVGLSFLAAKLGFITMTPPH